MNENRNNSYLISSQGSSTVLRACTPCCPFDAKNLPHPYFNYSSINRTDMQGNGIIHNSEMCCLSKLQVDCHIQRPKRKKKSKKNKRLASRRLKRSISSSSRLSPNGKRKQFNSNIKTNGYFTSNDSSDSQISSSSLSTLSNSNISDQSFSSNQSSNKYRYDQKSTSMILK